LHGGQFIISTSADPLDSKLLSDLLLEKVRQATKTHPAEI